MITDRNQLWPSAAHTSPLISVIMQMTRFLHSATLLPDGQVLIAGGQGGPPFNDLATAELYDPNTKTFTLLSGSGTCPGSPGCLTAIRASHTATLLSDGRVFLAGGTDLEQQASLGTTDLYDPASRTFSAGPTILPRAFHTATALLSSTLTAVTSSVNPSQHGQSVEFTAVVKSA